MAKGDLNRPSLSELEWVAERQSESLSAVFDHAVRFATATEDWYATKRRWKRFWGRTLRVGAIVLATVAAVLPIVGQIYTNNDKPLIEPGWAAVALATAAALVALDHYFGFSAGWTRFMAAELRVTRLRHDFEYSWQAMQAAATAPPSEVELAALLERARTFVLEVDDVIADETSAWIMEFQANLARAEESIGRSDRL
jgi:SMODS and SLOG-associating 2TM effector domain 2